MDKIHPPPPLVRHSCLPCSASDPSVRLRPPGHPLLRHSSQFTCHWLTNCGNAGWPFEVNGLCVDCLPLLSLSYLPADRENTFYSKQVFQCFSYIVDRSHQNSPSMHFRRANTDSGGPIRIQESQYGLRRANTELSVHFRKANTKPSVHFRRANTEPSVHFRRANTETCQKQNVNLSKRVGKDGVFLQLVYLPVQRSLAWSQQGF